MAGPDKQHLTQTSAVWPGKCIWVSTLGFLGTTPCGAGRESLDRLLNENRGITLIFGVQGSEMPLLSPECQHTVAEPVKVEKSARRVATFSTTIRSPSRRTAEFCGFAAVEVVKVRKLGLTGGPVRSLSWPALCRIGVKITGWCLPCVMAGLGPAIHDWRCWKGQSRGWP